ncbi:hypothetical protein [Sessilibacter sp. MAH4]
MSKIFLLQNHQGFFLNRQGLWVSGREPAGLFRAVNKDEAVNEVFEVSARDYSQRISIVETETTEKGVPVVDPSWISDLPEPGSIVAASDEEIAVAEETGTESVSDEKTNDEFVLEQTFVQDFGDKTIEFVADQNHAGADSTTDETDTVEAESCDPDEYTEITAEQTA